MFIRSFEDIKGTDRYKVMPRSITTSARFLAAADSMGVSLHVNRGEPIPPTQLWYKHHWEANYLISGALRVTDMTTGQEWMIGPGDAYQVGPNDRHLYEVLEDEHHISVFCPALRGDEIHDKDGAYSASGPVPVTDQRMFIRSIKKMRETGRECVTPDGKIRTIPMLTESDEMGFSLSDINFKVGTTTQLWNEHHWVTGYIISGTGQIRDLETGKSWNLKPDMIYSVAPKDRCQLNVETDLHLISITCHPTQDVGL